MCVFVCDLEISKRGDLRHLWAVASQKIKKDSEYADYCIFECDNIETGRNMSPFKRILLPLASYMVKLSRQYLLKHQQISTR
jgi:muconolactone delta-isomerase